MKRYKQEVAVLNNWLFILENNAEIAQWLIHHNYRHVGIYGLGILGKHLLAQLEEKLEYLCCIDRDARSLKLNVPVFIPDEIPEIELLIVTNVHIFNEIYDELANKNLAIISLDTLIKNVMDEI